MRRDLARASLDAPRPPPLHAFIPMYQIGCGVQTRRSRANRNVWAVPCGVHTRARSATDPHLKRERRGDTFAYIRDPHRLHLRFASDESLLGRHVFYPLAIIRYDTRAKRKRRSPATRLFSVGTGAVLGSSGDRSSWSGFHFKKFTITNRNRTDRPVPAPVPVSLLLAPLPCCSPPAEPLIDSSSMFLGCSSMLEHPRTGDSVP